jgi:competence protein ComEA
VTSEAPPDPLGTADDVLARLRLRARLTDAERTKLAEDADGVDDRPAWRGRGRRHGRRRRGQGRRGQRGRPKFRLAVDRPAALGVVFALGAVLAVAAWPALSSAFRDTATQTGVGVDWEAEASDEASGTAGTDPAADGPVVHVAGAVAAPGVFTLPEGSRVVDAIERAGGALPDADLGALNLAAPLQDGQQVYVPLPGESPPQAAGGGAGDGSGKVNVNTAGAEELTALPGVGPVLAQRIVDFRQAHGPFKVLADLGEVSGIGPKVLAGLEEAVSF